MTLNHVQYSLADQTGLWDVDWNQNDNGFRWLVTVECSETRYKRSYSTYQGPSVALSKIYIGTFRKSEAERNLIAQR